MVTFNNIKKKKVPVTVAPKKKEEAKFSKTEKGKEKASDPSQKKKKLKVTHPSPARVTRSMASEEAQKAPEVAKDAEDSEETTSDQPLIRKRKASPTPLVPDVPPEGRKKRGRLVKTYSQTPPSLLKSSSSSIPISDSVSGLKPTKLKTKLLHSLNYQGKTHKGVGLKTTKKQSSPKRSSKEIVTVATTTAATATTAAEEAEASHHSSPSGNISPPREDIQGQGGNIADSSSEEGDATRFRIEHRTPDAGSSKRKPQKRSSEASVVELSEATTTEVAAVDAESLTQKMMDVQKAIDQPSEDTDPVTGNPSSSPTHLQKKQTSEHVSSETHKEHEETHVSTHVEVAGTTSTGLSSEVGADASMAAGVAAVETFVARSSLEGTHTETDSQKEPETLTFAASSVPLPLFDQPGPTFSLTSSMMGFGFQMGRMVQTPPSVKFGPSEKMRVIDALHTQMSVFNISEAAQDFEDTQRQSPPHVAVAAEAEREDNPTPEYQKLDVVDAVLEAEVSRPPPSQPSSSHQPSSSSELPPECSPNATQSEILMEICQLLRYIARRQ